MKFDHYRAHLKRASWDWQEDRSRSSHKDRVSGRAEKRSARQKDRVDIQREIR